MFSPTDYICVKKLCSIPEILTRKVDFHRYFFTCFTHEKRPQINFSRHFSVKKDLFLHNVEKLETKSIVFSYTCICVQNIRSSLKTCFIHEKRP